MAWKVLELIIFKMGVVTYVDLKVNLSILLLVLLEY